jgi:BlaI family transcriptional regulator, penicillinase repressor
MNLPLLNQLSRRERQIMDALFEHRECSAQEIQQAIPDPPSYSAVRALLARLVEKGQVQFRQDGAKYIYFAAMEEKKAQSSAITRLLKTFFKGSRMNAVSALLDADGDELTAIEISELERKIQRLKERTKKD